MLAGPGNTGAFGISLNGTQVNDDASFFRAAANTFFARGNRQNDFSFGVTWTFNDVGAAEYFMLTHFNTLPTQATLKLNCGGSGSGAATVIYLTSAVIQRIEYLELRGLTVVCRYSFSGGAFTSEDVPNPPGSDTLKAKSQALSSSDTTASVVFDTPFGSTPVVPSLAVSGPSGGSAIDVFLDATTLSAAGFTVNFGGASIPAAGYYLNWMAVLAQ